MRATRGLSVAAPLLVAVAALLLGVLRADPGAVKSLDRIEKTDAVLTGLDQVAYTPLDVQDAIACVLIFTTSECPIANSYAPEINRIVKQYQEQGLRFFLVHVDPDITVEQARKHQDEFGYQLPILIDRQHQLVKAMGASATPEAAVVGADGQLIYRGCIDDLFANLGQKRQQPRHRYLRQAIEEVLAAKPVSVPRTKAVGCIIQIQR